MRKPFLYLLGLIIFLSSACNLPVRTLTITPDPSRTPGPVVFNTPPPTQPAPIAPIPKTFTARPVPTATRALENDPNRYVAYTVQSGDTLNVVAAHFGVAPAEIRSAQPLPPLGLLTVNQTLVIPKLAEPAPNTQFLLPDSEIVNSDCGRAFNIRDSVNAANGRLAAYSLVVDSRTLSGAEVVKLVAEEASVNPRFLLAFIEYRSHWVSGSPAEPNLAHPLGLNIPNNEGLYLELSIAANLVNTGYYTWREGKMTELVFLDGRSARISPSLNAGSVALQYLFARMFRQTTWEAELYGAYGFLPTYQKMFGDPLPCARTVELLFPDGIRIPTLELPFAPGETWALTGGLHSDWIAGTPSGAIDFAPVTGEPPCTISRAWLRAPASGIVTRSENGILQLALVDVSGKTTGWELLFMHVSKQDRPAVGTRLMTDDPIGHPSCEGGLASGTHVHIARLYRGEWIGAGDPFPFILSGWLVLPGEKQYQSTLVKGDQVVKSDINGTINAWIVR